jgi:hypothetical protein
MLDQAHETLGAGAIVGGKLRLEVCIGSGGMGSVWRARHLALGAPVAVKLIRAELERGREALARFQREAQMAANLRGQHVVQILDFGVDAPSGAAFIVMELLEGESLHERLARVRRLSLSETASYLQQVAEALTHAHRAGIIHRDLKPANVFIVACGETEVIKVLDFGIGKWESAGAGAELTRTGAVLGTGSYMSPEQISGGKSSPQHMDLWSLAVMAYECLTGQRPFQGATLPELYARICSQAPPVPSSVAAVPSGFDDWFRCATARSIAERFSSAREMVAALSALCVAAPSASAGTAPTASVPGALMLPRRASRGALAGALVIAGALGSVALWLAGSRGAALSHATSAAELVAPLPPSHEAVPVLAAGAPSPTAPVDPSPVLPWRGPTGVPSAPRVAVAAPLEPGLKPSAPRARATPGPRVRAVASTAAIAGLGVAGATGATLSPSAPVMSAAARIKGNITDAGKRVYHLPGCVAYDEVKIDPRKGERFFVSETDALAAGWHKAGNCR